MYRVAAAVFLGLLLAACSRPSPPVGRWEGTYESADVMVAARLEIGAGGKVRVSAPDLLDIGAASDEDRAAMRERLAGDLAAGWTQVAPRPMDFDGETFRKPGGIAPQIEWNKRAGTMTLVVYLGTRPAIHIPLKAVDDFDR